MWEQSSKALNISISSYILSQFLSGLDELWMQGVALSLEQ
jgi:hypothetical protein